MSGAQRLCAVGLTCFGALGLLGLLGATSALAAEPSTEKILKVCQDPNNLPFSNHQQEGIENRLAELMARSMGAQLKYHEFPQKLGFVRNTLRYRLPGQDPACDVIMGVPVGYGQTWVTKPYYRSTYALLLPAGNGLDGVTHVDAFLALQGEQRKRLRIGVFDRTPASAWLERHQLVAQGVPFRLMSAHPDETPVSLLEAAFDKGDIDAAVVWGPVAGFVAKRKPALQMRVLPMASEPGIQFDFAMGMGLRQGEGPWKAQLEAFIDGHQDQIRSILQDFAIPLVEN